MGDTTQSAMTQETMTELVECNTQLHKTLQGLWSDALTQHKLQQHNTTLLVLYMLVLFAIQSAHTCCKRPESSQ